MRAHKLAPENTDIIFLMAQVSMSQNYYEDAIPLLESGLQIAPQETDLSLRWAKAISWRARLKRPLKSFKTASSWIHSARSYAFLGLSYRNLGRFRRSKEIFQEGLKLDPHNATCLFNLGSSPSARVTPPQPKQFSADAASEPEFPDALLELANMRIAAKKYAEAEELLRRYVGEPRSGYRILQAGDGRAKPAETAAAERDLNVFKTLSKNTSAGPYALRASVRLSR